MKGLTAATLAMTILVGGCASIVGDTTQNIAFNSNPDDATIVVKNQSGTTVHQGETPVTFTMEKGDGSYFGGQTYTVTVEKDGYQPHSVILATKPNGWYIGGNFVFGGLIGWLVVDPMTGAMWTITPDAVDAQLVESRADAGDDFDSSLHIVLLEQVPEDLLAELAAVN